MILFKVVAVDGDREIGVICQLIFACLILRFGLYQFVKNFLRLKVLPLVIECLAFCHDFLCPHHLYIKGCGVARRQRYQSGRTGIPVAEKTVDDAAAREPANGFAGPQIGRQSLSARATCLVIGVSD
jgi:hypothetical protein